MKGIVDRFEDDKVVVEMENNEMRVYDREYFPKDIKEGDLVIFKDNRFIIDVIGGQERRKYINNLFNDLIDKGKD